MAKRYDLTGMRFGKLTAIAPTEQRQSGSVVWECRCDCGKTAFVRSVYLTTGKTKSCGCNMNNLRVMNPNTVDLTGRRFGKLQVVEKLPVKHTYPSGQKTGKWRCKCDCGKEIVTISAALLKGTTKSCGCTWRSNLK